MAERYTRLFSLESAMYAAGSPVVLEAGALLRDNKSGDIIAQLKFRNVHPKSIKMLSVELVPMDTMGRQLGETISFAYLDLVAPRDLEFGSKQPIPMPNGETRAFSARVREVGFADNTICNAISTEWEPLELPTALESELTDGELVKQFWIEHGQDCKVQAKAVKDLWYCTCGALNRETEDTCRSCGRSFAAFQTVDIAGLTARMEERLAAEKAERERQKAEEAARQAAAAEQRKREAEQAAAKRKKQDKVLAAVLAVAAVCIAVFLLVTKVVIPNQHYNAAVALMDAGQYEDAIAAFEAMEGYKDSAEQIALCQTGIKDREYDAAVALMNAGKYKESIAAFEALNGYKNSTEQIKQSWYNQAADLMEEESYEEAIIAFRTANGYQDSNEKIVLCQTAIKEAQYADALELKNAGKYAEAIEAFEIIAYYKDADNQIMLCQTAINDINYANAENLANEGKYSEAYEEFTALKDYKDSDVRAKEAFRQIMLETVQDKKAGETFSFGEYHGQKIEWQILTKDSGKILVISKYGLDFKQYSSSDFRSSWSLCDLRSWLNDTFLNSAFTADECEVIAETNVIPEKNPYNVYNDYNWYNTLGEETTDKVFILSITEAERYLRTEEARQCKLTAYAKTHFISQNPTDNGGYTSWWLRVDGDYLYRTVFVFPSGSIYYNGKDVKSVDVAVRPALWIDLNPKN